MSVVLTEQYNVVVNSFHRVSDTVGDTWHKPYLKFSSKCEHHQQNMQIIFDDHKNFDLLIVCSV